MSLATHSPPEAALRGKHRNKTLYFSYQDFFRFDNLRDRLKQKEDFKYDYDNSTSKECNDLIESMEKSVGIQFLWTNIKPLIRGKILYSPDTPATRYSSLTTPVNAMLIILLFPECSSRKSTQLLNLWIRRGV